MRHGLTSVLSEPAAKLYERLVVSGGLSLAEHPELDDGPDTRELVEKGFARKRYIGAPLLVCPSSRCAPSTTR